MYQDDQAEIQAALVGRRVVAASIGDIAGDYRIEQGGILILDDGTELAVIPNQGGCVCGAGDYELKHLATVDNIITSVKLTRSEQKNEWDMETTYDIFVFCGEDKINLAHMEGSDGNGYYGTGYRVVVRAT